MKKTMVLAIIGIFLSSCIVHFHLDFLGEENLKEVTLMASKAKEKILVIDIEGIIGLVTDPGVFSREEDLLSQLYSRLEKAAQDANVRSVILRLDTPGGEVTASDILYREVLNFKKKTGRPVIALMMGMAASGGYYVASACDAIIAHPSSITGSIGVISIFPNVKDLMSKLGIQVDVLKSGEMKDSGSVFRTLTEKEKAVFQQIIDEHYENFLEAVHRNRKDRISLEELRTLADGRIYTGIQAHRLNLVDEVGYFDSALKKALSMASLKKADVVAYTYHPKRKTNIYASALKGNSSFDPIQLERLLPTLESGFYYLWLPQSARE